MKDISWRAQRWRENKKNQWIGGKADAVYFIANAKVQSMRHKRGIPCD